MCQSTIESLLLKLAIGGLVGWGVVVSVDWSVMAERNWYWAHTGIFPLQNQLLFFEMELKRVT
jgi:hypothetical protein